MKHLLRKSSEQKSTEALAFQMQDHLDTWDEKQSYEAPQMFFAGKAKDLMAGYRQGNFYDYSSQYQYCVS